jgi:PleD family two-component response regulator
VAERRRKVVLGEQIAHVRSVIGPYLTVSQGVNTIIPGESDSPTNFLEAVDKQLYRAKQVGRNSVFPSMLARERADGRTG